MIRCYTTWYDIIDNVSTKQDTLRHDLTYRILPPAVPPAGPPLHHRDWPRNRKAVSRRPKRPAIADANRYRKATLCV